jgi:hypothetical protein
MLAAAVTMAVTRPKERRFHFKTHSAAKATASNHPGHETFFARPGLDGNSEAAEDRLLKPSARGANRPKQFCFSFVMH